jgi:hypothetical protein
MQRLFASVIFLGLGMGSAYADLNVRFNEGAPKDQFSFTNNSGCAIMGSQVILDLSTSKAGLIFDVTGSGAGVEVYQPLEIVSGGSALSSVPKVKDGDTMLRLDINQLATGETIAFTIDIDDAAGGREITVSDDEITGANVSLVSNGNSQTAMFEQTSNLTLPIQNCAKAS